MLAGRQTSEDRQTSHQRYLERLRNSVIMRERGDSREVVVSIDPSMTMTLTELPAVISEDIESRVIDMDLMSSLNSSKTINWCRTVRPMYPLRTAHSQRTDADSNGSRDSLLVAMTTAMWGSSEVEMVEMVRRLVYVTMTQHEKVSRLAERCGVQLTDQSDADDDVTRVSSAQWKRVSDVFSERAAQSAAVNPIHIFVLSNVIRRPIIVVRQHTPRDADSVCGIYLPVLHAPTVCCRSPLVVVHVAKLFVPLVARATTAHDGGGLHREPAVPLWRADADEALVVRCLLDTESAELALMTYLRVAELPHTSATSTGLYPVAKYDVVAPDINIMDEFPAPVADEPALLASPRQQATVGYRTVLEQMTAGVNQLTADSVEYRACQTAGCEFYALQQHNWKCSRCYVNESTGSQSASSTAGHVQQLMSHTKAQSMVEEREPHWSAAGLTRRGVTSAAVTVCSVPSCDQPVCDDRELHCARHAAHPTNQLTHSTLCTSSHCNRPASDKYAGLCANCYVISASSPRDVNSHVVMATGQVCQVGGTEAPSCIMDFCSNKGSAECKGLCQQCFSALCQTRLQSAADVPTSTTVTATAATNRGGRALRASVKCMMEGCRTMVGAESEICDSCRRKQMQAYEDAIRGYR